MTFSQPANPAPNPCVDPLHGPTILGVNTPLWYLAIPSLLMFLAPSAAPAQEADSLAAKVRQSVDDLSSPNPRVRDAAEKSLIEIGAPARKALVQAAQSDDPALKATAGQLLLRLPWYIPSDAPDFRELLKNYGGVETRGRRQIIRSLSQMKGGYDVLLRLITEEPADAVKWAIVAAVRDCFTPATLDRFRALNPDGPDATAPLIAAAGHAWFPRDPQKALKLLNRAVDRYFESPSSDAGEVEVAIGRIGAMDLLAGKPETWAQLLRKLAPNWADPDEDDDYQPDGPVVELFALHARFGPLKGYDDDLKTFEPQLADPRIQYCQARILLNAGKKEQAEQAQRKAFEASADDRFRAGDFLLRQGWFDWAKAQWESVLGDASASELQHANANFRLARVAASLEDPGKAAGHLRKAMQLHQRGQGELRGSTEDSIHQEILWYELRAARDKGDHVTARVLVEQLRAQKIANPDIAIDVVTYLQTMAKYSEADAEFARIQTTFEKELAEDPEHPQAKNNLAWLFSRCNREPKRALELAQAALASVPDNPALMDTLAEAYFHVSQNTKAIQLEEQAVKLRPSDPFLKKQLARFKAATKK